MYDLYEKVDSMPGKIFLAINPYTHISTIRIVIKSECSENLLYFY